MNLKKAKMIRSLVKELVAKDVIKMPWTRYGDVKHERPTGELTPEGAPIIAQYARPTRVLDPMCPRGVYHRMKNTSMAAVLSGQG